MATFDKKPRAEARGHRVAMQPGDRHLFLRNTSQSPPDGECRDGLTARRQRTMSIVSGSGAAEPEKSSRQGSASGRGFVVVTTPFVPGTPGVSAAE